MTGRPDRSLEILWVSHLVPYPPRAGVLSRAFNLLAHVSRHHRVTLLSMVQSSWIRTFYGSVELGLDQARENLSQLCAVEPWVAIPTERFGKLGRMMLIGASVMADPCYTVRWLKSRELKEAFVGLTRSRRFDLVHFDTVSLAQYRSCIPGVPASLGHHNIESHMLLRRADHESRRLASWYLRQEGRRLEAYERTVAPDFDVHVTCSRLDSDRLLQIAPGSNVHDVPNGVDIDFFRPGQGTRLVDHDLVFVGTMDWYPNAAAIDFFLDEVWPELKRRRPTLDFGVIGSNPSPRLLERAQATHGVEVYGYVDDVRPYLEGARIFVCPIRDGGGTKLKILDALASGCCVVAHPTACEGIDVEDELHVRLARTPAEFVEAIEVLLDAPATRASMAAAGRDLMVRSYSYDALGRRLADLWRDVVDQRGPAER